jgi:hypothetical protein
MNTVTWKNAEAVVLKFRSNNVNIVGIYIYIYIYIYTYIPLEIRGSPEHNTVKRWQRFNTFFLHRINL